MKNKFASALLAAAFTAGTAMALPTGRADINVTTDSNGNKVLVGTVTTQTTVDGKVITTTATETKTYAPGADIENASPIETFIQEIAYQSTEISPGQYSVVTITTINNGTPSTSAPVITTTPPPTIPSVGSGTPSTPGGPVSPS